MPEHEEIYALHADSYERMVAMQPKLGGELASIRDYRGLDVVDLGAGTGRLSAELARDARTLTALDRSPAMLAVLENRLSGMAGACEWRALTADHRSLPLPDSSADLAVSGWSIGYVANTDQPDWRSSLEKVLSEIDRVLRDDGTAILFETLGTGVTEPVRYAFLQPYFAYLEREAGFSHRCIPMDYTFASVEEAADRCGFFFGGGMAERIRSNGWRTVPEFAGVWWKHKRPQRGG